MGDDLRVVGDLPSLTRRRLLLTGAAGVLTLAVASERLGALGLPRGLAEVGRRPERLEPPPRRRWTETVIGESRQGRPMLVYQNVVSNPRASVVAIAALHGNERGIAPAAMGFTNTVVPDGVNAFVLPIANPDGWAANQRRNANGVDLNRNFPVQWRRNVISGPSPASEPETRAMMDLVDGIRPTVTVWMHEMLRYVAHVSPAAVPYAEAWARPISYPTRSVFQYGGGESWTGRVLGLPSVLVEGESFEATVSDLVTHRLGFDELLTVL